VAATHCGCRQAESSVQPAQPARGHLAIHVQPMTSRVPPELPRLLVPVLGQIQLLQPRALGPYQAEKQAWGYDTMVALWLHVRRAQPALVV
jgi:hypothetical protein